MGGAVPGVAFRADPVAAAHEPQEHAVKLGLIQRALQGLPDGCLATTGLTVEPW